MRILASAALALVVAGSISAAENPTANYEKLRHNVGVGLGTMLWSNVGTGLGSQICAATTNGTFGNQTFAVTSGTSNADKWDGIVQNKSLNDYVRDNMDAIARDAAAGQGESLDAVADLIGIPATQRAAFAARLQASFSTVFASGKVSADQVVARLADIAVAV